MWGILLRFCCDRNSTDLIVCRSHNGPLPSTNVETRKARKRRPCRPQGIVAAIPTLFVSRPTKLNGPDFASLRHGHPQHISTYINRPFISLYHGLSWFYSLLLVLMDKGLGACVCPRSLSLTRGLGSPLGSETVIWMNRSPAFLPSVSASLISRQGMEFR